MLVIGVLAVLQHITLWLSRCPWAVDGTHWFTLMSRMIHSIDPFHKLNLTLQRQPYRPCPAAQSVTGDQLFSV